MLKAVCFLGNPGLEYAGNRHNAGRLLAVSLGEEMARADTPLGVWQKKYKGLYAAAGSAHFLMPETFMNLSGQSLQALAAFFKIPPQEILVAHDELELPLGVVDFRFAGGLGGHNGLRSINACLGSADFWRLRIGIGRPSHSDIAGYVLQDFSAAEKPVLDQTLAAAAGALREALRAGPESLLPGWRKKKIV